MENFDRYILKELIKLDTELKEKAKIGNMVEIIDEYKQQNNIEVLTDDEFTNIFGELTLSPNYYLPISSDDLSDLLFFSEYKFPMLVHGVNLYEDPKDDLIRQTEDGYDLSYVEDLDEAEYYEMEEEC
jgi:hypothetical protein